MSGSDRPKRVIKRLKIASLPEGYYRERLTSYAASTEAEVWVVAVPGECGDWSAYIGWPEFEQLKDEFQRFGGNAEYYSGLTSDVPGTASYGDKLSATEARAIFAGTEIVQLRYRE